MNEALDRSQIYHAMTTYGIGVDTADVDLILTAFTPDALLEARNGEHHGHQGIRDFFELALADGLDARRTGRQHLLRHNLTTSYVTFSTYNQAQAQTYFLVVTAYGPDHSGVYTDEFVKDGNNWLIKNRRITVEWYGSGSWYESRRIKPVDG
jgi:hypothetical protein